MPHIIAISAAFLYTLRIFLFLECKYISFLACVQHCFMSLLLTLTLFFWMLPSPFIASHCIARYRCQCVSFCRGNRQSSTLHTSPTCTHMHTGIRPMGHRTVIGHRTWGHCVRNLYVCLCSWARYELSLRAECVRRKRKRKKTRTRTREEKW